MPQIRLNARAKLSRSVCRPFANGWKLKLTPLAIIPAFRACGGCSGAVRAPCQCLSSITIWFILLKDDPIDNIFLLSGVAGGGAFFWYSRRSVNEPLWWPFAAMACLREKGGIP